MTDGILPNEKTEQQFHFPRRAPSRQQRYATFVLKATAIIAAAYWLLTGIGTEKGFPKEFTSSSTPSFGKVGAVATESAICSRIGTDILDRGGNAADAAIASTLCVGTVGMYHSGIGGGGFAVIRSPNGFYDSIDFRETAPQSASQDMFKEDPKASIFGDRASGVPGEIRGLQYIHEHYGSLPWNELVAPAARVARDGWTFGEDLDRCVNTALNSTEYDFFAKDPSWAMDFAPDGKRLRRGDHFSRRRYADTLDVIADRGPDAFYKGFIAERIVNATNSSITLEDLKEYSVRKLKTASVRYKDHMIFSSVAPSSGAILLSTLRVLDGFDNLFASGSIGLSTHRLVEALKFAFGQRARIGDPAFVPGLEEYQSWFLSDQVAKENRDKILDDRVLDLDAYNPDGFKLPESHGTSHISTTDHSGLSVSLTTTINLLFGSHVMDLDTGIIMNNVMNDFSIPGISNEYGYAPSSANFVHPGKRPLSSVTPVFVEDLNGNLQLVIGAAGGSRIITSTLQSIVNVLERGMTMAQALREPRLHDQLIPAETGFEAGYDAEVISALAERGHNVTLMPSTLSAVQGIICRPDGTFDAASEPRQKDSGAFTV
ncbi:Gamma-glutamyltransferase [Talaromyces pinophilus]|nr:Gamma-glutamyltransferase [Talaromyces pinophilus]